MCTDTCSKCVGFPRKCCSNLIRDSSITLLKVKQILYVVLCGTRVRILFDQPGLCAQTRNLTPVYLLVASLPDFVLRVWNKTPLLECVSLVSRSTLMCCYRELFEHGSHLLNIFPTTNIPIIRIHLIHYITNCHQSNTQIIQQPCESYITAAQDQITQAAFLLNCSHDPEIHRWTSE